jgi:tetratricopeptide (TPR) repeat protein
MKLRCMALLCFVGCATACAAQAHSPISRTPSPHANFSREPFVIEQYVTTARFENDGTGNEDLRVRVRIQSEAGVAPWSELIFGYDDHREKIDVRYARVRRGNGAVTEVPADAVKDTVAGAARDFPTYANCKEKHISLASLAPGDTLEYEVSKRITAPAAPREFWLEHTFIDSAVVLDERLAIDVPATRRVSLKSSAASPYETKEINGRKIYSWKHSHLKPQAAPQQASEQTLGKSPDVQLTTFASWNEIARWYAGLTHGRVEPTPEIRAKTKELIEGCASDNAKAEALYSYVSKKIRYAALPFGAVGYQPHIAADVFSNRYGDAQDKHTLLAAMLSVAGISAEPVLIPSMRKLDATIPFPAQFDRVITVAHIGNDEVWMDSTVDVAPYRMLAAGLRKKSALLISAGAQGKLVETPSDPPFLSIQRVDINGRVTELGKLTAQAHYLIRGDTELVLRSAFHRAAEAQWKEIGQTVLTLDGIHGDVTAVHPSDPTATHDPFEVDIDFAQSNFIGWSNKTTRTALPLLVIGLPDPPADKTKPIELGSPLIVTLKLKLSLPATLEARPPAALSLAQDFAEFHSSYQFADHTLIAERTLDFKMRELPPSRGAEYAAFTHAVNADESQPLVVENTASGAPSILSNATVDELLEAGLASLNSGNAQAAIPLFERVVQLDPQHKTAWNDLGLAYMNTGKLDQAIAAFQSELEANPSDEHANQYLGLAFERKQNYAQAAAAFRKQTQMNPLDPVAHGSLGDVLLEQHEYAQAVPEFEKATVLSPENPQLQAALGRADAEMGKSNEAVAAFEKAATLSRSPETLNEVAFNLADEKLDLDKAERYAEIAIADSSETLRSVDLGHVTGANLAEMEDIAAYWDTLGWVYFQKNDLDRATKYIRAAWLLSEDGEAGDHLAQVYERLGQKERAIHACALALAAPHATPDTRARLTLLIGANAPIDNLVRNAKPELETLRTLPAGKLLATDARADFFVLLSPGERRARVDTVKFISGSEALRPFADRLRALDYGAVFPDASPTKLIRRGRLSCSKRGECTFTLILPEEVHSAD